MKHTDILVINPGSTTTKIAVFRDMKVLFEETITHDPAKLKEMGDIFGQMDFREELIRETLRERGYDAERPLGSSRKRRNDSGPLRRRIQSDSEAVPGHEKSGQPSPCFQHGSRACL